MADDPKVEVYWHEHSVSRPKREQLLGQQGCVVWFTGFSASGKSTIANLVDHMLNSMGKYTYLLDGDNVRHGLGLTAAPAPLRAVHGEEFAKRFGLGFSAEDREENIRRVGAVARLFCDAGTISMAAFISPYRIHRDRIRDTLNEGDFIEVFVDAPLDVCESRDPKGLYKKARSGELKGFTGIDDPYESPNNAELVLNADGSKTAPELAEEVIAYLKSAGKLG